MYENISCGKRGVTRNGSILPRIKDKISKNNKKYIKIEKNIIIFAIN